MCHNMLWCGRSSNAPGPGVGERVSGPLSRVLFPPKGAATISLGPGSHPASNDLPGRLRRGPSPNLPYLIFLQVGFALPALSPGPRCALTAPFHPYRPGTAVCFLWHFP